jgi:hypothetical protein
MQNICTLLQEAPSVEWQGFREKWSWTSPRRFLGEPVTPRNT